MPPPPPKVNDSDLLAFSEWLRDALDVGAYQLDVASDMQPQIAPEGARVFQLGDKVFTIWKARGLDANPAKAP